MERCTSATHGATTCQVVDYAKCRFRKRSDVARALGLDGLEKSERALDEFREAGLLARHGAATGDVRTTR